MSDGQPSLREQLSSFYQGMQGRMAPDDWAALKRADKQLASDLAGRVMLRPGDAAPMFSLTDQHGKTVGLAPRLALGPVVLVFSRGGWCPFCTLLLRAWQEVLPQLHDAGGDLLAIMPQGADACGRTAERDLLAFPVLSDPGGKVAERYGVVVDLPKVVRPLYLRLGHDLPRINGSGTWRLPLSSSIVVASDGPVAMAHADPALQNRLEPAALVELVRSLVRP